MALDRMAPPVAMLRCSNMREILVVLGFVLACVVGAFWYSSKLRAECEARGGKILYDACVDRSLFR